MCDVLLDAVTHNTIPYACSCLLLILGSAAPWCVCVCVSCLVEANTAVCGAGKASPVCIT